MGRQTHFLSLQVSLALSQRGLMEENEVNVLGAHILRKAVIKQEVPGVNSFLVTVEVNGWRG